MSPIWAQTSILAPTGWKTQARAGGVATFTPLDLTAGEVYSVTIYDAAPMYGKTLDKYLHLFAGPVEDEAGSLAAPLDVKIIEKRFATATGAYRGPNGTELLVAFIGVSLDGQSIHTTRILSSQARLMQRYEKPQNALLDAMMERANGAGRAKRAPDAQAPQAAAQAEAPRYPFVVAPGKGVAVSQIALVLHHSEMNLNPMGGSSISTEEYLLLRDGTVHAGLPVPPDQLNLAASRRGEPEKWGKWRRKGKGFEVSWAGKVWEELDGERVEPGAPQTRLSGRFGTGSGGSGVGMSSYAFWGVTFDASGRFRKDSRGGTSSGFSPGAQAAGMPSVSSAYDDNGSSTIVTGPGVAVQSERKKNPNGDREGTYAINGYTLTLRYDNGQAARWPFFFYGAKRQGVWFEDSLLFRDEE